MNCSMPRLNACPGNPRADHGVIPLRGRGQRGRRRALKEKCIHSCRDLLARLSTLEARSRWKASNWCSGRSKTRCNFADAIDNHPLLSTYMTLRRVLPSDRRAATIRPALPGRVVAAPIRCALVPTERRVCRSQPRAARASTCAPRRARRITPLREPPRQWPPNG